MISDVSILSMHLVGNLVSGQLLPSAPLEGPLKHLLDVPGPFRETDSRFFVSRNLLIMKMRTYVLCFCSESSLLALLRTFLKE